MKLTEDLKAFHIRMPKDIWLYLKHYSADKGLSMTDVIIDCIQKQKKKVESKLTQ